MAETLASEQRPGFVWGPRFLGGAALSTQGEFEEAAACLREGLASRLGALTFRPYGLVRLAEAMERKPSTELLLPQRETG